MAGISIIKKAIANSLFLSSNVSRVSFSSTPTSSEGYHASEEYKRKPDNDKGFNDDRTVADAGDRILEMNEKTKKSMEESMAKIEKKIKDAKKKEETSIADNIKEKTSEMVHETKDKVKKKAHDVKEKTKDTMESIEENTKQKMHDAWEATKETTHKIKESVVGKWDGDKESIEDHTGRKKKENVRVEETY
ncbi:uncharacterized protein LOC132037780 [Lycium ferocissimum]|uniref:uncharacterized protein LOC132037780 n=1 Tax=Lycium ferocissimum TaxID=112874 RepID=UPI00281607DE|nr:uncharacterized protein LOC132037780 [Lycium ferocissimum]